MNISEAKVANHKAYVDKWSRLEDDYRSCVALLDFLSTLPALKSTTFRHSVYHWSYSSGITLSIYDLPLEMAIDLILGPVHRQFGTLWKMSVDSTSVNFSGPVKKTTLMVHVYYEGFSGCTIRTKEKTVEQPAFTKEIEYFLDCTEDHS